MAGANAGHFFDPRFGTLMVIKKSRQWPYIFTFENQISF